MQSAIDSARKKGFFETVELREMNVLPPEERVRKGRVAVIECVQDIPCNPCGFVCKFDAIRKDSIGESPRVDWSKCTGCRLCISICPGLAIFNIQIKNGKGYITMPYELLPKPKVGESVVLMNRAGEKVGRGKVTLVLKPLKNDPGLTITVEVPQPELVYEVRSIKVTRK